MMTTILVTSDLHSDLEKIAEAATSTADAWLDLGDEHDKDLQGEQPFYDHNRFLAHPSAKTVLSVLGAVEELEQEYESRPEEVHEKIMQLTQNPAVQAHLQKFMQDFLGYATKERKKLDEKYALYKKPKYRILGNHDPALRSEQLPIINNRVEEIAGIKVAGATATGEATRAATVIAALNPTLYAHLRDFTPIDDDKQLEKITADVLRQRSPAFRALENQQFDVLGLHAPVLTDFAYNEHDEQSVYDAALAKLLVTAKKKPQIVIWGHDHYEFARLWKRDGIVYAFVGPHRQLGLKFDDKKKLTSITVKAYANSPALMS